MPIALEQIIQACLDAAALLPRQGPITKFAFLNPLQGLEHVHFDKVMQHVGELYGNEAYLDDKRYREKLKRHRIVEGDLREVLAEELGERAEECVSGLARRDELRLAMLIHPLHFGQRRELDWVLAETDSLKQIRPEVPHAAKADLLKEFKQWVVERRHPIALASISEVLNWPAAKWSSWPLTGFFESSPIQLGKRSICECCGESFEPVWTLLRLHFIQWPRSTR